MTTKLDEWIQYNRDGIYENIPESVWLLSVIKDYLDHDPEYLKELEDERDSLNKEIDRLKQIQSDV